MHHQTTMNLRRYDAIVISTSGGKDSVSALRLVTDLAKHQGVLDRVLAVHADLGELEHDGTLALVRRQCEAVGVPLEVVKYQRFDGVEETILEHVERIGRTPGRGTQFCTSDHKRGPIWRVFRRLAKEAHAEADHGGQPAWILDVQGIRADESAGRKKRKAIQRNKNICCKSREVETWYPLFDWSTEAVWNYIQRLGLETLSTYDRLPRHSCQFCIYAPVWAWVQEAKINPTLAAKYAAVEAKIDKLWRVFPEKDTKKIVSMAEVIKMAEADVEIVRSEDPECDWCQQGM